jgi:hypothetical protein
MAKLFASIHRITSVGKWHIAVKKQQMVSDMQASQRLSSRGSHTPFKTSMICNNNLYLDQSQILAPVMEK